MCNNNYTCLEASLTREVLAKMGVSVEDTSQAALTGLYRAWATHLGMENLSKRLRLLRFGNSPTAKLSLVAAFENFIRYGTSGTCWITMEMFISLARSCGFDARPRLGEMTEPGLINHGSVIVVLDGMEYSVDQNLLWSEPLVLDRRQSTVISGVHYNTEASYDRDRQAFHIRRFNSEHEFTSTILIDSEPKRGDYLPAWLHSYEQSYFNQGYFINRIPGGTWRQLDTNVMYELETGAKAPVKSEPPAGLPDFIEEKFGLSAPLVHHLLQQESTGLGLG